MKSKSVEKKEIDKLIFVDNLELSFKGCIPLWTTSTAPDQYGNKKVYYYNQQCHMEYQPNGNKWFRNIADLWIDDRKIGELRFSPRQGFIDDETVCFKFDNVQLYQQDFHRYVDSIVENIGLKYCCINHLDIAVDCIGYEIIQFIHNYIEKTRLGKKYSVSHKGKVKRDNMTTKGNSEIWWGNIKADKYIKIYNKLEELDKPNNHKNYIPVCWKTNGMIVEGKSVERLELTLRQPHCKLLDYKKLCDTDYLASIIETHCKNYFEFEKIITNHHKKYTRDVTPINFKGFKTILLPKFKYVPQNSLQVEKITLKQLYFQYLQAKLISSNQYELTGATQISEKLKNYTEIKGTIESMLYKYPTLEGYYNQKIKSWNKEFNSRHELKNGRLKIEDYLQSLQLTRDLVANVVDEQIYDTTDEVELISYKKSDRQGAELVRSCKNVELKQQAQKSKLIGKISKPITEKVDLEMKANYRIRHIGKEA